MWWEGPNWLRESPEHYPKAQASDEPADLPDECTKEVRARQQTRENHTHGTVLVNAAQETATHRSAKLLEVIDCARYSTCTKLFRVTALVLKFVSNLKERRDKSRSAPGELSSKEISEARKTWIREIQRQIKEQTTLTQQLGLYKDEDNILRCRGRLANAHLSPETRYPILMPRDHHISKLIVEDCHRKVNHGGLRETLAELRSQYWVTKGRRFVKKTLHRCVTCKRLEGIPFKSPRHADLPETGVTDHAAFTHVGVDFAGPLFVKTGGAAGEMKKTYICLYTCATSRALHLELTPDLSTAAFLRCLRRYIARRGTLTSITSNNTQTFK